MLISRLAVLYFVYGVYEIINSTVHKHVRVHPPMGCRRLIFPFMILRDPVANRARMRGTRETNESQMSRGRRRAGFCARSRGF